MPLADFNKWLDSASSTPEAETQAPFVHTRSGRTVRPPDRFDSRQESNRERELKDLAKAIQLSKLEAAKSQASQAQEQVNLDEVDIDIEQEGEEEEIPTPDYSQ